MYESSCSYAAGAELKRCVPGATLIKSEEPTPSNGTTADCWPAYRFTSTFEQLKQSVEKAKQALQDRGAAAGGFLGAAGSAFSELYPATFADRPKEDIKRVASAHQTGKTNNYHLYQLGFLV